MYFLSKNFKKFKPQIFHFLIIFLILFISSLIFKMHDDFPYYHFPYSYILTQHNLILGLGNLDLGFRTPSSLFYLNSIFYLPYMKFYMFMMPSILILGFSNSIIYEKIINNIKLNKITIKFITADPVNKEIGKHIKRMKFKFAIYSLSTKAFLR